jgi:hypothetical protein
MRKLRNFLRYVRRYAYHKDIDWTLKNDDWAFSDGWPAPIFIVDINWALWAAAVRLGSDQDTIVVWPLWRLYRNERSRPRRIPRA